MHRMHNKRSSCVPAALIAGLLAGCDSVPAVSDHPLWPPTDDVTPVEIRWVMDSASTGWFQFASDGTPLNDTLSHAAGVAAMEIEGGDQAFGDRLMRYVFRRGYRAEGLSVPMLRQIVLASPNPQAWRDLADHILEQEPHLEWARAIQSAAERAISLRSERDLDSM